MWQKVICVTLFLAWEVNAQESNDRPLLSLSNGNQLRGIYQKTLGGRTVSSFLGIPYGTAGRFEPPTPARQWSGVLEANSPSPLCLQYSDILSKSNPLLGQEDCLFLDVVTAFNPNEETNCSSLRPVVAVIQGGGFLILGSQTYSPLFLMDQDVVHVGFNSRLGIFGYLSTKDRNIPGNWGMKDQQLALKWVQANIETFCGDKNKVTLIGESSGGASAMYHSYSRRSRGLSHRIISMSGNANSHWAIQKNPIERARMLGVLMNCTEVDDSAKLRTCLRSKDAESIARQHPQFKVVDNIPWGPVVEPKSDTSFLTKSPISLLLSRKFEKKPMMFSSTTGDGLIPGALFVGNSTLLDNLNTNWLQTAPNLMDYNSSVPVAYRDIVSKMIKAHYFGDKNFTAETLPQLVKMLGDRFYVSDATFAATQIACRNKEPTYYFLFNYFPSNATSATFLGATLEQSRPFGPCHGDDIGLMYNLSFLAEASSDEDIAMVKSLTKMIATFADTGVAVFGDNVKWKPLSPIACITSSVNHLRINSPTDYKMMKVSNLGDFGFWNRLPLSEPATFRGVFNF